MEANPGYFVLSPHILVDRLPLPAGTEIIGARWDEITRQILVFVRHPHFPPAEEGIPLQRRVVVVTQQAREPEPGDTIETYSSEWSV